MSTYQSKLSLNIKKAQGTLKKVQEMIDSDQYCADIAHQVNATMGLLQSINRELLKHHLSCCGVKALSSEDIIKKAEFIDELVRTWDVATRK